VEGSFRCLVGKAITWPHGKRSFERPRHRWEDDIKIDLKGNCLK
jgi:hypothetical protein